MTKVKKLTKHEKVKRHLKKYGSITKLEGFINFNYLYACNSIRHLRRAGWDIESVWKENKETQTRYVVYTLRSAPEE